MSLQKRSDSNPTKNGRKADVSDLGMLAKYHGSMRLQRRLGSGLHFRSGRDKMLAASVQLSRVVLCLDRVQFFGQFSQWEKPSWQMGLAVNSPT